MKEVIGCRHHDGWTLEELMEPRTLDTDWPYSSEAIRDIALRIREKSGRSFIQLPFDTTLEALCLGASIHHPANGLQARVLEPGNGELSGIEGWLPRITEAISGQEWKNDGRVRAMWKTAEGFVQDGERLVFNITGPVTLFSSLMGFSALMKQARKKPQEFSACIEVLVRFYSVYAGFFGRTKPSLFSYADPLGAMSLLGPTLFEGFSVPLQLQCMEAVKGPGIPLHVCGVLSKDLQEQRHIVFMEGTSSFFQETGYSKQITGLTCINGWK